MHFANYSFPLIDDMVLKMNGEIRWTKTLIVVGWLGGSTRLMMSRERLELQRDEDGRFLEYPRR